jgi:hypothetical protein
MTTCSACTGPMDPVLTTAGYSTHPLCEPYAGPEGADIELQCATAIIKVIEQSPRIPASGPEARTGACARCGQPCERYGRQGKPLCGSCPPASSLPQAA